MSVETCLIAHRHAPPHLTLEQHHVIPVAWQQFWAPATPPFPGHDPDGRGLLWDERTVALCPTHHRNVHALLVLLTHQVQALAVDAVPATPFPGLPRKIFVPHAAELSIANLGLERTLAVGGSLLALAAAGEWGEA